MVNKKLFLLILFCSLLVLITGLTSELSLGDEVYHYRFARDTFNAGKRVAFDSLYGSGNPPAYFYDTDPLWHLLLVSVWKLFGRVSFPIAQFYHTIYYALLILFTYLLGKELYGEKQGLYSALIVATIPAVVTFSILFYLDIPATCLSVLCILLILKRRFLWSGVVLGLMYLMKSNTWFFIPAFITLILYQAKVNFRYKIKNLLYIFVPAFLIILPDFFWREKNLKSTVLSVNAVHSLGTFEGLIERVVVVDWKLRAKEHYNSYLLNPLDIVKYFGVVLLIASAIYAIFKIYKKKDLILWLLIISYFLLFCYLFTPTSDIRYILPIVPLLAILSSKAVISYSRKKWLKALITFLCLLQFGSTLLYVNTKRQIPKGIKEGFVYLREKTAPDSLIIYPEYVILEAANRRFVWAGRLVNALVDIFWNNDESQVRKSLKANGIDYIAIKKSRIYDDSKVRNFKGYPKSFIERLPKLPFVKLVFDNNEISIWQVKR